MLPSDARLLKIETDSILIKEKRCFPDFEMICCCSYCPCSCSGLLHDFLCCHLAVDEIVVAVGVVAEMPPHWGLRPSPPSFSGPRPHAR